MTSRPLRIVALTVQCSRTTLALLGRPPCEELCDTMPFVRSPRLSARGRPAPIDTSGFRQSMPSPDVSTQPWGPPQASPDWTIGFGSSVGAARRLVAGRDRSAVLRTLAGTGPNDGRRLCRARRPAPPSPAKPLGVVGPGPSTHRTAPPNSRSERRPPGPDGRCRTAWPCRCRPLRHLTFADETARMRSFVRYRARVANRRPAIPLRRESFCPLAGPAV